MRKTLPLALLLAVAGLVPGASQAGEAKPAGLTDKQIQAFAEKIEATLNAGDGRAFDAAIDIGELVTRSLKGTGASKKLVQKLCKNMAGRVHLGVQLAQTVKTGGSYRLLRVRKPGGEPRAVFRMLKGDTTLNYHELLLAPRAGGGVRIVDVFIYSSGELLSNSLRRGFLPLVVLANRGALDKLPRSESEYIKNLPKIQAVTGHARGGRFKQALAVYAGLPDSLKKDKTLLIFRVQCAMELYSPSQKKGETEYLAALTYFKKHHPNDPGLDLLLIDSYFLRKQYPQALRCVDRLDKMVGGDPYLDLHRGNARLRQGKFIEAKKLYNRLIKREPKMLLPYAGLVGVSLKQKDFKETARLLRFLETKFKLSFDHIRNIPDHAEFLKSEEGKKWRGPAAAPATKKAPPAAAK